MNTFIHLPLEADCYYHIYNRGINGEDIFKEEKNYPYFRELLIRHIKPSFSIISYCLLKNHFHLFVQAKRELPKEFKTYSQPFSNFFNAYTKSINKAYERTGGLFETPFRRKQIKSDEYFSQLIYYVHANPQKHGFVADFKYYRHSSFRDIQNNDDKLIDSELLLKWFNGKRSFLKYHELYREDVLGKSAFD